MLLVAVALFINIMSSWWSPSKHLFNPWSKLHWRVFYICFIMIQYSLYAIVWLCYDWSICIVHPYFVFLLWSWYWLCDWRISLMQRIACKIWISVGFKIEHYNIVPTFFWYFIYWFYDSFWSYLSISLFQLVKTKISFLCDVPCFCNVLVQKLVWPIVSCSDNAFCRSLCISSR